MDGAQLTIPDQDALLAEYDAALEALEAARHDWARRTAEDRIALLEAMKDGIMQVAEGWAELSARKKGLQPGTPLAGEEWFAGPYATMAGVNAYIETLRGIDGKSYLDGVKTRTLVTGQTAVQAMPHSFWDRLLLSGVRAEIWMQRGVSAADLKAHAARVYDTPPARRRGKVALVLGAGNVAAITPLDVLHKLIVENQVVILKMNPVNDYLTDCYRIAMKPFIDIDALRIVKGDARGGAYLCEHPVVEELHITGSDATHDAIVWGTGEEGERNRKAGTPKNRRRFTSELGSVSPTIVVPGPWSAADLRYQAESIATMKLHNSGHNCVACQALIMPRGWDRGARLLDEVKALFAASTRPAWYPGTESRLAAYAEAAGNATVVDRGPVAPPLVIGEISEDAYNRECEVFAPALGVKEIDAPDPETYLRAAVAWANEALWGTLGANILIHPRTIRRIGRRRFEEIVADLKYGTIAINTWNALAFLSPTCPWGAFPGHSLDDIGSGIGTVHNAFMLEDTERTVIEAPWRPFPRGLLSGQLTLLPRPPFFVTNRKQHKLGKLLTEFHYRPGWSRLPRIFVNALSG